MMSPDGRHPANLAKPLLDLQSTGDKKEEKMKKKLFIFTLIAVMLVMTVGCAEGAVAKINTPEPGTQSGTPNPDGQINVPGVDINIPGASIPVNVPGPNPLINKADGQGRVAGILTGIWHGIISPVTLVVSFINPNVQMYAVHNDGSPYNLGFMISMAIVFLILGAFAGSKRR